VFQITVAMARTLDSLPPEMLLHIAVFLDQHSLCSLIGAARFLHILLWEELYKRDATHNKSVGFIRCIRAGAITAVSKFIAAGVDVNARVDMSPDIEDFYGYTFPLATAVVRRQREIVRLLLEQGADVCASIEGALCSSVPTHMWAEASPQTPLSVAVAEGHVDIAMDLVQKLGNPNAVVCDLLGTEYTALEQAALLLHPDLVRELLQRGADPNRQRPPCNSTVLHQVLAVYHLRVRAERRQDNERLVIETVMTLLRHGADPFLKQRCSVHSDDGLCRCGLSVCAMGAHLPSPSLRQHFRDLAHRQVCGSTACRESRHQYGATREDVPGHCRAYSEDVLAESGYLQQARTLLPEITAASSMLTMIGG